MRITPNKWKILAVALLFVGSLFRAQPPMYFNTAAQGGSNTFPFNNFTSGTGAARQVSWFIPAGSLGTLPPVVLITRVYINFATSATCVYPTFEIGLKTSTGSGLTGTSNGPVETGFTTVLTATNYTLTTTGGQWRQFVLQTPFLWTSTALPLVVRFQHNATSGGPGPMVNQPVNIPGPGNGRQWADYNATNNTGIGTHQVDFGIDIIPFVVNSTGISCSTLGTATAVATGTGPFSYTWMPGAQTGSVASGLKPGTYTITMYDAFYNITYSTTNTFTTPIPYNGTVQSTGQITCNGATNGTAGIVISGGSGNTTYQWSNGSSTFTTATLSGLGAGSYSVTVTDVLTNCVFSQNFVLTQPAPVSLSLSSSASTVCVNDFVTLTGAMSGGIPAYSYSWTSGPSAAQRTVSQGTGGNYVYALTAMDANNCPATGTIGVAVISLPNLSIQSTSVCAGQTGTLTASGATSYTWLPGNTNGATFTATPLATSVYTVIGSASACVTQSTAAINFKAIPSLSFTTFSITCASLGSATVTPSGGTGPFTFTWLPVNQTGAALSGLNPNTYTVSVFDAGTGCLTSTTTTFNSLIPLTGNLLNTPSLTCFGNNNGTASFTNIAGGSLSQNYLWTNGLSTLTGSPRSNLTAGSWSVTVTDALTGCQIFSVFTISQPPAPTLNITSSTPSTCLGTNISFTGLQTGGTPGYTYSWTNGPQSATRTIGELTGGTFTYYLTSTDANNCKITNSITVNFVPNPVLTVSDVSICPLKIGTLSVSGATTYTWNGSTSGNTYTDNPLADTEYTVVGSALGCTTAATASIILYPSPVPILTMQSAICESSSLPLNASGGSSYVWSGPGSFNSAISNPTINPVSLSHNGVFNLTVTSVNGCTASTSANLTVNPTPSLSATGATVCTSQTIQLTANSIVGASFGWTGPMNFSSKLQNPSISNPALSRSGIYKVIATSVFGCTNTVNVDVLVVPPPSLTGKLSSHSLCSQAFNGSPNTITLTAGGANTYSIVTLPDMSISNPGGPITNLTPIPPNTGAASATLSGSNGVCTVTMGLTFSVIPNPSVTISSTPIICAGEIFTYTSHGAQSYTWSSATPGFSTYNNGGIAVAHPSINSVFSVFGGSLGCYSASKTSSISVSPLPSLTISPIQPTVCLYNQVGLTVKGSATLYHWTTAPGLINGSGPSVTVNPLSQQVYTVTGELNKCFTSATIAVNVLSLPEPTIATFKDVYCENDNITLKGTGGEAYEWKGPSNIYYQTQSISSKVGSGSRQLAGGVYSLTVTDKNGCKNTTTKLITVYELPQGSLLGFKENGCLPLCSEYDFKSSGSSVSSSWRINNQNFGEKFKYCYPAPGIYTVSGVINDKTTGCINQLDFFVTVYPKPEADFNYSPLRPIENLGEVKFTNTSNGKNQTTWNWYFLNNNGFESSEENLSFLFTEPGEYPIAFVVTDQNSCQDTMMKVVKVEPDFTLYIPDAFTPNGDDLNDVFLPIVRSSKLYTLSVFDRWGKRIFYSTSPQTGWDGTFLGSVCKMDVYSYIITLSTVAGEKKEYTGHISLVR